MPVQLCSAPLKYKDTNGNYQDIVGIKGEDYVLTNEDKAEIAGQAPVQDVQVNGTSVLSNGVANVPIAEVGILGVVKPGYDIAVDANGTITTNKALLSYIKDGGNTYSPIVPDNQHQSAFYGLAKAAGDTTQRTSSNAVGNYTESAKSAISQMLNAPVTVSGTTPVINGLAGIQYICGEVSTITINPPASGCIDVIFESGSTVTVLTVPNTIKWPDWFDPDNLETNATYEINILNGIYGAVGIWT